jgi:hypothetical protein
MRARLSVSQVFLTLFVLTVLHTLSSSAQAQQLPRAEFGGNFQKGTDCDPQEHEIGAGINPQREEPIIDVGVKLPLQGEIPFTCQLTFTTEAATNTNRVQLMVLSYRRLEFDDSDRVVAINELPVEGPILSRVADGFDQTHTFVNRARNITLGFDPNQVVEFTAVEIQPVLSSAFGEQYRIARHCLFVECIRADLYSDD